MSPPRRWDEMMAALEANRGAADDKLAGIVTFHLTNAELLEIAVAEIVAAFRAKAPAKPQKPSLTFLPDR